MAAYRFQGVWDLHSSSSLQLTGLPTSVTFTLTDLILTPDINTVFCDLNFQLSDDVNGGQTTFICPLGGSIQLSGLGNGHQLSTGSSGRFTVYGGSQASNLDLANSSVNIHYYIAGTA